MMLAFNWALPEQLMLMMLAFVCAFPLGASDAHNAGLHWAFPGGWVQLKLMMLACLWTFPDSGGQLMLMMLARM